MMQLPKYNETMENINKLLKHYSREKGFEK